MWVRGKGVERMCEKEIVVRRIWRKSDPERRNYVKERNDVEGEVKRDILVFRASLKGLRRDVVQLSLGKGSSRRLFVELFPLSCKMNYVNYIHRLSLLRVWLTLQWPVDRFYQCHSIYFTLLDKDWQLRSEFISISNQTSALQDQSCPCPIWDLGYPKTSVHRPAPGRPLSCKV